MKRFVPPIVIAVCVAVIFGALKALPEETKERADPYLLFGIGIVFTLCMLTTLTYTRSWTIRSAGILLTLAGDGILYTSSGSARFWALPHGLQQDFVDLARSCFYAGAPLLFIGLVLWVYRNHEEAV